MKRVMSAAFAAVFMVALSASAFAQKLTGTVTNSTTGKPAAGVEVLLLDPMAGMTEITKTKTDAQGKFSLNPGEAKGPRLLRVPFQGVNYHTMITPGKTDAQVTVYEAAKQISDLSLTVENAFQADSSNLQGAAFFVIHNKSNRALVSDKTFEFFVPQGAKIDSTDAQGPGGQAIPVTATPEGSTGKYSVNYPMRPGETLVRVSYRMPYTGEATMSTKLSLPADRFLVVTPSAMKFEGKTAGFAMAEQQPGMNMQSTSNVKAGEEIAYKISGTGMMQDAASDSQGQGDAMGGGQADNRPGGGLGRPIDSPDALANYRVPLLIVLLVLLFGTAYLSLSRTAPKTAVAAAGSAPSPSTTAAANANPLLDAMKEELFQLELDRQQGKVSQDDYEKHKAALDATLQRALARSKG